MKLHCARCGRRVREGHYVFSRHRSRYYCTGPSVTRCDALFRGRLSAGDPDARRLQAR